MIADTCFIIDLMKNNKEAVEKLEELNKHFEPVLLSSLTVFELISGLTRCKKPEKERGKIKNILEGQTIISLDKKTAEKAGEIDGQLIKEGKTIGPIDSMIAASAIIRKTKVITRNKKDFENIEGLVIEEY